VFVALLGAGIALRFLPAAMKVGAPAPIPLQISGHPESPGRDTTVDLVPALSINTEVDL
jgi:hypothetical protein